MIFYNHVGSNQISIQNPNSWNQYDKCLCQQFLDLLVSHIIWWHQAISQGYFRMDDVGTNPTWMTFITFYNPNNNPYWGGGWSIQHSTFVFFVRSLSQPFLLPSCPWSPNPESKKQKRKNLPTSKWCCECAIHGVCRGELILPRCQETRILIRPCGTIHWDVDIVTCSPMIFQGSELLNLWGKTMTPVVLSKIAWIERLGVFLFKAQKMGWIHLKSTCNHLKFF